ncbi:MAG: LLM class flavin-dependent oxidoreductase, partial [Chromatiales bacterium]|nr:LLM class flavin-dependent oxidoreductase [Chromatiales bacterium]
MRIGMFMTQQWRPGDDLGAGCRDLLEQARAARDNGFASVLVGQHMITGPDMQMLQTMPLMARLLPEIEGMQIGPSVLLLPMLSPVLVAEEAATLDWMSDGHFVLACGLGYREEEFEAMGTRRADRVSRLEEGLEVIRRLWTEERVTHHGRHFHLSDVGASV